MHRLVAPCTVGAAPVVGAACNSVTAGLGSAASGVAGSIFGSGIGAVFDAGSQWVAAGAVWLLEQVGSFLSGGTNAGLGTTWFKVHEKQMAILSASMILPMAFIGLVQAVYRQSTSALLRSFVVNLPLALLFTGMAVEIVRLSLALTDQLSREVLSSAGVDTTRLLEPITTFLTAPGGPPGAPAFVVFIAALVVGVCAFALWLELVVRSAAIAACVLFLPLVMGTLVWPAISHWCRRLAETIAALVLSKFVVCAVLSLAVGAIAGGLGEGGGNGGGFAAVVTGIALLLVATLSPFTLLRLVPAVEAGAVAHLESVRHRIGGRVAGTARGTAVLAMDIASLSSVSGEVAETSLRSVGTNGSLVSSHGLMSAGSPGDSEETSTQADIVPATGTRDVEWDRIARTDPSVRPEDRR